MKQQPTQKQRVLDLLKERGSTGLSAREAIYDLQITRLAAIVYDLKKDGYFISSAVVPGQTARYFLLHDGQTKKQRGAIQCQCGHPNQQHVKGTRCMANLATGFFDLYDQCPCVRFTEDIA